MSGTFDYVKYSEDSAETQKVFKLAFENLESIVQSRLLNERAKSLVMTKLEEAYMWVGKSIRDSQENGARLPK